MKRNSVFNLILAVILITVVLIGTLQPVQGSGGPDDGGYMFEDSNDSGGPVYAWDTLNSPITVSSGNDVMSGPFSIPFTFQYYDQPYNELYISSNGFITFTGGQDSASSPKTTIPDSASAPHNFIAGWWGNLNPSAGGTISYETMGSVPNRVFIVQFFEVHHKVYPVNHVSFQIKLYEGSNNIEVHYRETQTDGNAHSAGIENLDGSAGLTYYSDTGTLITPIAVRYKRFHGVALSAVDDTGLLIYGQPGQQITHTLKVSNWTDAEDSFTITHSPDPANWSSDVSIENTGLLSNGQSANFTVTVTIPEEALPGDYDELFVKATSDTSPGDWTVEVDVLTAVPKPGYVFDMTNSHIDIVDTRLHNLLDTKIAYAPLEDYFIMNGARSPDGRDLWVIASGSAEGTYIFDLANPTATPQNVPTGNDPSGMTFNENGTLALFTNHGDDTVSVVDNDPASPTYRTVIATIPVGDQPVKVSAGACLRKAYVANANGDSVSVIDLDSRTVTKTITGLSNAWQVVLSPTTNRAYVVSHDTANIYVLDTYTDSLVATWNVNGSSMNGADITPDGSRLYVSSSDLVKTVNTATGAYTDFSPGVTDLGEMELIAEYEDRLLYVSSVGANALAVLDITTNPPTLIKNVPLDGSPNDLALNPPSMVCQQAPVARFTIENDGIGHLNEPLHFTDHSYNAPVPGTTYDWNFGDGSEHTSDRSPQHTYTVPGTYTVTLTLTSDAGTSSATGTVNFAPRAAFTQDNNVIRVGDSVTFTNHSTGNPELSYTWNFGDATAEVHTADAVHQYTTAGDYTVTLTVTNTINSKTYTSSATSKVDFAPTAAFIPADSTIQTGQPLTFTNQTTGTATLNYTWDFGDGSEVSHDTSPTHTYTVAGDYTVRLTVSNAYGDDEINGRVRFRPLPLFTPTDARIHLGDAVQFENTSTGTGELTYDWDFGDSTSHSDLQNPSHTYAAIGSYTVTLAVTNAIGTETATGTVNFLPVASYTQSASVINLNGSVTFTNTSTGTEPLDYTWNFDDGTAESHAVSPVHQYTTAGNYTVRLTAHNAWGSDEETSTVHFRPAASFTPAESNIQLGTPITFTSTVTGSTPLTYAWTFGDGSTSSEPNPTHTYTTAADYTVRLVVTNDWGSAEATGSVVFHPKAIFSPVDSTIYPNQSVDFTSTSTGNGLTYDWGFGDESPHSSLQNPSHTYTTAGKYIVRLTVTNSHGSDYTEGSVEFYPTAAFTQSASIININDTVAFTNHSTGTEPMSYTWNFGDGSAVSHEVSPSHRYTAAGNYTVTLTATNAHDSDEATSTVRFYPVAGFTPLDPIIQEGASITFTNTSTGSTPLNYTWNFGDGSPVSHEASPTHPYTSVGTGSYTVTLTAQYDTYTSERTTTVRFSPTARFTPLNSTIVTGGSVTFTNSSTGTGTLSYTWNFGDGSPVSHEANPTHQYNTAGDYTVRLTVTNTIDSHQYTHYTEGKVVFSPTAGFTPLDNVITTGSTINFTNTSTGTEPMSYRWNFGDGSPEVTTRNTSHRYDVAGDYVVTMTVTNQYGDPQTATTTVRFSPTAHFTPVDSTIQTGDTINFKNQSVGTAELSYDWDFGDGSPHSTLPEPSHTYTVAGDYEITLVVTNGYGDSTAKGSVVFSPRAILSPVNTTIHINDPVDFTSSSTGSGTLTYTWNFGDGSPVSHQKDPTHTYTTTGDFQVKLTVTNGHGTDEATGRVLFYPTASFTPSRDVIHVGDPVTFTNTSVGTAPLSYTWNFGDGTPEVSDASPNHVFNTVGLHKVTLTVKNDQGEDTAEHTIQFYAVADFSPKVNVIHAGESIHFINASTGTGDLTYVWNFGDGSPTTTETNPTHVYAMVGPWTVSLTATNNINPDTETGTVRFAPVAKFSPNPVITRLGQSISVTNESTASDEQLTYDWDFGDGTPHSSARVPTHTYAAVGIYDLTLKVTNRYDTDSATTKVYFAPVASFEVPTHSILPGDTVTFTNTSTGGGTLVYEWDFGDGSPLSHERNPVHTYPRTHMTRTVKLTVTNEFGTSEATTSILVEQYRMFIPVIIK